MQRSDHVGLSFLMLFMFLFDVLSLLVFVHAVKSNGVDVLIMFAFEVGGSLDRVEALQLKDVQLVLVRVFWGRH